MVDLCFTVTLEPPFASPCGILLRLVTNIQHTTTERYSFTGLLHTLIRGITPKDFRLTEFLFRRIKIFLVVHQRKSFKNLKTFRTY